MSTNLPHHLVIIGGGYIGLEFAQMYRRSGSEVTIIETVSHLARHEDEDVPTAIRGILEHEGINVRLHATCIGFSRRAEDILAQVDCASGDPEVSGSHVLLAVGRRPNTDDLGLTNAGVAVDKRGYIFVDDQLHTSVPGIWALGDCNAERALCYYGR
jgi:pyruvate/2-oxoglutarate dehydrogenase complex dihydrolipoamide dehydrogenase (E3) component